MFSKLDSNGSGEIDESDFEQCGAAAFGFAIDTTKAAEILAEMRTESPRAGAKAGVVNMDTFVAWWKSAAPMPIGAVAGTGWTCSLLLYPPSRSL